MPSRSVSDEVLLERLTDVFRSVGFDGASLAALASATGLRKSSLYHRFPGGKAQMAAEVAQRLSTLIATTAMAPLDTSAPIVADVREVGRRLTAFYEAGAKSCLLEAMSLGVGAAGADAAHALAGAANRWIEAFARVAITAGATSELATARAEDAIAAIEGALVLARVTGNTAPFARAIDRLPHALLGSRKD